MSFYLVLPGIYPCGRALRYAAASAGPCRIWQIDGFNFVPTASGAHLQLFASIIDDL